MNVSLYRVEVKVFMNEPIQADRRVLILQVG